MSGTVGPESIQVAWFTGNSLSRDSVFIHPTADVSPRATVGDKTKIWHEAQVREGAVIGRECIIGKGVYVDKDVHVGDRCKLQNGAFVYHGFHLEDGVFVGPGAMLLNDKYPRAINPDGSLKSDDDWEVSHGVVGQGASIGGGAIVLPGVRIGRMAVVGSGAVVTRDVPERGIVVGSPAKLHGFACDCGRPLRRASGADAYACASCGRTYTLQVAGLA
jgi:UDP-2-acetamido-3-amino-2,3-dideoxy-glucuronate N-acetyltransferase